MLAPVDIAVLILMGITAAIGFWTGFIWQVIRIISVIASIWVALAYQSLMAGSVANRVPESYRNLVCTLCVFAAAMLVCYLAGYLFREVVNALKPQLTDRILGAAFGLVVGALIAAFLAFSVMEYSEQDSPLLAKVEEASGASLMGRFLRHTLPDSVRRVVEAAEEADVAPLPVQGTGPDAPAPEPPSQDA